MKIYVATSCTNPDLDDLTDTIAETNLEFHASSPRIVARSHADALALSMNDIRDAVFFTDDDIPDDDPMYSLTVQIDDVDPDLAHTYFVFQRDMIYAVIHVTVHDV